MFNYTYKAGSTSKSVTLRIIDATTGVPITSAVFNSAGMDLQYRREGAASVAITEATLAALTTAWSSGGFLHIGNGYYRLDLPDAALAAGSDGVLVHGVVTGMVVIGAYVQLVAYDPYDTVRLGLTALPNAAAEAAGGLYTRGTGAGQLNQPANGRVDTNVVTIAGTTQTARDLGASVLLSSGTGTGQLDFTAGVVKASLVQILGTALTETAGQIAAAFKKWFDVPAPVGTVNSIPNATAGATGGLFIAGTNAATTVTTALTTTFTGNLTGSVASVTGAVGSVTGAVGSVTGSVASVTGAVGSVTGNVGGNVTGSVGSVAAGGIAATSFAAGAIDANAIATDAITSAELSSTAVTEIRALANGTANSGTTTTMVSAARTEADTDYWVGQMLVPTSGNIAGQARYITAFNPATDTITFAPATTQAWATQTYEIWPGVDYLRPTVSGRTLDVSTTGEAGVDWANVGSPTTAQTLSATTIATSQVVASVTGAVGSVTGAVASVTGNVGGNVTGSVGSVVGAVGSVTGAVGSVSGNVSGNVTGSVGSLAAQAQTDVKTQVVAALNTDTYTEPGQGAPGVNISLAAKIGYLYKAFRNRITQTSTTLSIYADDAVTVDHKSATTDDGVTYSRGEISTGP
jgi:hypothetical protein